MSPALITSLAALVTSVAVLVSAWSNRRRLGDLKREVKTSNGLTLAALADRAEGRRIDEDIPEGDRTASEQRYVDDKDTP